MQTSLLGIVKKAKSDKAITLVLLRKRVFTKSPVRENRTPGSLPGLSGNWQSYRDQLPPDAKIVLSRASLCRPGAILLYQHANASILTLRFSGYEIPSFDSSGRY